VQKGRVSAGSDTLVTAGRPYSADAVTESVRVLGDGNRISNRSVTHVFRDNDGRTRREQLPANGLPTRITITDPVAGVSYTLDPATKVAVQGSVVAVATTGSARGRGGATALPSATATDERLRVEQARVARVEMAETSLPAAGQMKQVLEYAAAGGGNISKENLGEQMIEGVRAIGTRSTTVIPAGSSVGNMNEIRIISEQWFSPDLQVLVMTRHSDPRVGETIYKLTNIVRGQPDPNLFVLPPDYTVKGRSGR
jgi:hypothetical protein